jgi:hypothetical protein
MDPCCVPYCFFLSLAGLLLLVRANQAGVGVALERDYQYLHVHANEGAQTSLQAAMLYVLPAVLCGIMLCRAGPKEVRPRYLEGPDSREPNSSFDAATNRTPLLSSS